MWAGLFVNGADSWLWHWLVQSLAGRDALDRGSGDSTRIAYALDATCGGAEAQRAPGAVTARAELAVSSLSSLPQTGVTPGCSRHYARATSPASGHAERADPSGLRQRRHDVAVRRRGIPLVFPGPRTARTAHLSQRRADRAHSIVAGPARPRHLQRDHQTTTRAAKQPTPARSGWGWHRCVAQAVHPGRMTTKLRLAMTEWTAEDVLNESRSWVSPWYPPTSRRISIEGYELYVDGTEATVMTVNSIRPVATDIQGILAAARRCGVATVRVTVGPHRTGTAPTLDHLIDASDVELIGTVDTLARELSAENPHGIPMPPDIQVDEVRTHREFALYERTSALAWGYPAPTDDSICAGYGNLTPGWFIVYRDGRPVGAGGYSLLGQVARLWGAAVVSSARGHGAYRALISARLDNAIVRGAQLALTHAEPSSSPILRRVGFRKFGEQSTFRLKVPS